MPAIKSPTQAHQAGSAPPSSGKQLPSQPFLVATALVHGKGGIAEVDGLGDASALSLSDRIAGIARDDRPRGTLTITLQRTDGRSITVETTDPIGSPEKPLTSVQLEAKFRDCAECGAAAVRCQCRRVTCCNREIRYVAGCAGADDRSRRMTRSRRGSSLVVRAAVNLISARMSCWQIAMGSDNNRPALSEWPSSRRKPDDRNRTFVWLPAGGKWIRTISFRVARCLRVVVRSLSTPHGSLDP